MTEPPRKSFLSFLRYGYLGISWVFSDTDFMIAEMDEVAFAIGVIRYGVI